MRGIWTVEQIRAAEQRLMATQPHGTLMAAAARAVATEAAGMLGFTYGAQVVLLVGSGDNGADALYAGADLARRGARVRAVPADPDRVHPAALQAFRAAGGRCAEVDGIHSADVIIDGLLGIGGAGALRPSLLPLIALAERLPAPVLSVDVASGVDAGTGATAEGAIRASVTVCVGALKPGVVLGRGAQHCGRVVLADIGVEPELPPARILQLEEPDVRAALGRPGPADDKYSRGLVGVAAGSSRYPGAAQLAVGSALLGGVGAVRYAGSAAPAVVQRWPEVLVTTTVAEAGRVQAWAVGPGLGEGDEADQSLEGILGQQVPVVVDADGLTLLAARRDLLTGRTAPTVLTPHAGEFRRFFPDLADLLDTDRLGAARRAADSSGAVVLLKGSATIVAQPDGMAYVNSVAVPALATAGSGDVLSGLLGAVLATGTQPGLAAAMAAYLHARAGLHAAAAGPVVAMDLVPALRSVLADLA